MKTIAQLFVRTAAVRLEHDYLPKVMRCLELLPEEDLWWRPHEGTNGVGQILRHLEGNLRQWVICGLGAGDDRRDRDHEFSGSTRETRDELLSRLSVTVREAAQVLRELDEATLQRRHRIQVYWTTGLDAAFHAVEHFSGHVGQVIWITKLRTGRPVDFYSL
ncbi:MAG: DUF1572 family protein [Salinibacterium sp.]|nr:DUF1572 family protein [Salinibacterium sp.]